MENTANRVSVKISMRAKMALLAAQRPFEDRGEVPPSFGELIEAAIVAYPQGDRTAQPIGTIAIQKSLIEHQLEVIERLAPDTARRLRELIAAAAKDLANGEALLHAAKSAAGVYRDLASASESSPISGDRTNRTVRK